MLFYFERKSACCLSFIPECVGGSVFIACRFLWRLDNNSSFHIKPIMCDGVVVLTNVSYIFLLVFDFDPRAGDGGVLRGEKVITYTLRCSSACLSHFRRRGSFYPGLSSK